MSENEIEDLLEMMLKATLLIQERFLKINAPDEFVISPEGVIILDAISMRLQVIGESVKKSKR